MPNAIYYRDDYALLPDGFATFEAFMADLRSRPLPAAYPMIPLLEHNRVRCGAVLRGQCMAPCFLSGMNERPLPVVIRDPDEVYPVTVERLSMAEYNARLRQVVLAHCPGCSGYTPIDDSDESLDGHHYEISLDGVCFFRHTDGQERPPLNFGLTVLGECFLKDGLLAQRTTDVRLALVDFTGVPYSRLRKQAMSDGSCRLHVRWKAADLLSPLVTAAADAVIRRMTEDAVCLVSTCDEPPAPDALLAPENRAQLHADCAHYRTAVAELCWDGLDAGRVGRSLARLEQMYMLHVAELEAGRALLLLLDEAEALRGLRYRTPLLQAHGATLTLHDTQGSRACAVSWLMPFRPLD